MGGQEEVQLLKENEPRPWVRDRWTRRGATVERKRTKAIGVQLNRLFRDHPDKAEQQYDTMVETTPCSLL